MMRLIHHTTRHALKNIIEDGELVPVYDCVWFTLDARGEMTAGATMPSEHRARIVVEVPDDMVSWFHDVYEEFPHLNLGMLNLITDTSVWYISDEPIPSKYFVSTDVMNENNEWINYEN